MKFCETDPRHECHGDQMARNRQDGRCCMPQEQKASLLAVHSESLEDAHSPEMKSIHSQFERAKVQRRRKHGEVIGVRIRRHYEAGLFARQQLSNRIFRSLPDHLRASKTILQVSWYRVHCKAAELALEKAHQSARQLGLTHVSDTKNFVEDHCGWYVLFCSFSCWLFPRKA